MDVLRLVDFKRLIYAAAIVIPGFIYLLGEEDRIVNYLEARGYSDVQIEHPAQYHCVRRWTPIPTARVRRAALPCMEEPASYSSSI
jgi:hypothetical protein